MAKTPKKPTLSENKVEKTSSVSRGQFKRDVVVPVFEGLKNISERNKLKNSKKSSRKTCSSRLTFQQQAFIDAMLTDPARNATNAAREAGYAKPESMCTQLLHNPKINAEIKRQTRRASLSALETLQVLGELARSDISDFVTVDAKTGKVRYDLGKAITNGKSHLVKSLILYDDGAIKRIELHDKAPYLQMIAKNHGLLAERVQVDVSVDRSQARDDLASRLSDLLTAKPGVQAIENGNITGLPVIDVTDESSQSDSE